VENPQANLGVPLLEGNKNLMRYSARPLPLEVRISQFMWVAGSLSRLAASP
jgi:hypothetical protein